MSYKVISSFPEELKNKSPSECAHELETWLNEMHLKGWEFRGYACGGFGGLKAAIFYVHDGDGSKKI